MSDGYPWFPFYAADYLTSKKVRRLTWAQRGVYAHLLAEQWVGGPHPHDPQEVASLIGADVNDVMAVLELCHSQASEGWINERLEYVRAEQAAKSAALARAGRKGAKAKWGKRLDGDGQAMARLKPGSSNRAEQSRADNSPSERRAREGGKKRRALPPDWRPNEGHHTHAKANGLDAESEAEQFRDHHTAKGSVMLDWDAAFRTWLRNAKRFRERDAKPGHARRNRDESATHAMLERDAERWQASKRATEARLREETERLTKAAANGNATPTPANGTPNNLGRGLAKILAATQPSAQPRQ